MANINIDRAKLAEYIKQNAQAIADGAHVDLNTTKIETMGGAVAFEQSVEVYFKGVPLDAVEANT